MLILPLGDGPDVVSVAHLVLPHGRSSCVTLAPTAGITLRQETPLRRSDFFMLLRGSEWRQLAVLMDGGVIG